MHYQRSVWCADGCQLPGVPLEEELAERQVSVPEEHHGQAHPHLLSSTIVLCAVEPTSTLCRGNATTALASCCGPPIPATGHLELWWLITVTHHLRVVSSGLRLFEECTLTGTRIVVAV